MREFKSPNTPIDSVEQIIQMLESNGPASDLSIPAGICNGCSEDEFIQRVKKNEKAKARLEYLGIDVDNKGSFELQDILNRLSNTSNRANGKEFATAVLTPCGKDDSHSCRSFLTRLSAGVVVIAGVSLLLYCCRNQSDILEYVSRYCFNNPNSNVYDAVNGIGAGLYNRLGSLPSLITHSDSPLDSFLNITEHQFTSSEMCVPVESGFIQIIKDLKFSEAFTFIKTLLGKLPSNIDWSSVDITQIFARVLEQDDFTDINDKLSRLPIQQIVGWTLPSLIAYLRSPSNVSSSSRTVSDRIVSNLPMFLLGITVLVGTSFHERWFPGLITSKYPILPAFIGGVGAAASFCAARNVFSNRIVGDSAQLSPGEFAIEFSVKDEDAIRHRYHRSPDGSDSFIPKEYFSNTLDNKIVESIQVSWSNDSSAVPNVAYYAGMEAMKQALLVFPNKKLNLDCTDVEFLRGVKATLEAKGKDFKNVVKNAKRFNNTLLSRSDELANLSVQAESSRQRVLRCSHRGENNSSSSSPSPSPSSSPSPSP